MPHQCVKCSRILPLANKELLEGCKNCGGKFFFYIKQEQLDSIKNKVIDIKEKCDEIKGVVDNIWDKLKQERR